MNDGPANTGFKKSFKLSCTTADNAGQSNLANADGYLSIEQRLEGYDIQCLKKGTTEAEEPSTFPNLTMVNFISRPLLFFCSLSDKD